MKGLSALSLQSARWGWQIEQHLRLGGLGLLRDLRGLLLPLLLLPLLLLALRPIATYDQDGLCASRVKAKVPLPAFAWLV